MPDDTYPIDTTLTEPLEGTESVTPSLSPEDLTRELEKTRREAAKYRTKLREREEADKATQEAKRKAELTAEERAIAAEKKAEEALAAADARVLTAERKAALAGKVTQVDRVLRLMDDPEAYFNGSTPDVDAILRDFPEYGLKAAATVNIPGSKSASEPGSLRPEDFRGKGQAWALENVTKLKPPERR